MKRKILPNNTTQPVHEAEEEEEESHVGLSSWQSFLARIIPPLIKPC